MESTGATRRVVGSEMEWAVGATPEWSGEHEEVAKDTSPYVMHPIHADDLPEGCSVGPNGFLSNGGRVYRDPPHPEYSTPEIQIVEDKDLLSRFGSGGEQPYSWLDEIVASELVSERCMYHLFKSAQANGRIGHFALHNRVIDKYGTTWGYHQNYLASRNKIGMLYSPEPKSWERASANPELDFLLTFLGVHNLVFGAGAVVNGEYVVGQKSSQLDTEISEYTVHTKPLLNARDEPLADPQKFRRVHLTTLDSNISVFAKRLRYAYCPIIFDMVEAGERAEEIRIQPGTTHEFAKHVSADPTLKEPYRLANGEYTLPIEIFKEVNRRVKVFLQERGGISLRERWAADTMEDVLAGLEEDPMQMNVLDWTMRRRIIDRELAKKGAAWNEGGNWQEVAGAADLLYDYTSYDPKERVIGRILRNSVWKEWMPPEDLIERRMTQAPPGRPRLRAATVADELINLGWDHAIPKNGREISFDPLMVPAA